MAASSGYECVAAFSHDGILRRMTDYVLQTHIPAKLMPSINCAIAVYENDSSGWIM